MSEFEHLAEQCQQRHERTNAAILEMRPLVVENRERLVELCGRSGKNGVISEMRKDIAALRIEFDAQRRLLLRVIIAALGTSGAATALGHALLGAF